MVTHRLAVFRGRTHWKSIFFGETNPVNQPFFDTKTQFARNVLDYFITIAKKICSAFYLAFKNINKNPVTIVVFTFLVGMNN